ncbi:DUF957 domain-containing protein [Escherichia coli]|nr:DUF957 domain-containing protein [Escherichia coli]EFA4346960.1 DUF957 domain-containing protein [Escherichia coli]EFC9704941.1 DUF957 domain-containing protein [Escherichia coli]EFU7122535.1 DUF957 domain-containing protein [Escherichia coli]MHU82821.1 DUF957 domain-containing protein [Escherichia coli]
MQGSGVTDGIGFTLTNNIDCESGIIFDNDEDKTDSAVLFPWIERACQNVRELCQFQRLQKTRTD